MEESCESEKENKSTNNSTAKKKLTTGKTTMTGLKSIKKATSTLKFQPSISKAAVPLTTDTSLALSPTHPSESSANKSLVVDNQILTNELVTLTREVQKLRAETRVAHD